MNDEKYSFVSDVIDKKTTARSARNRRTHTGKGGRVRLPSDNLSKKELEKMNGECKSYRLNSPMTKEEFMSMPKDLRVAYVKIIRQKFNAPDTKIGEMLGMDQKLTSYHFRKLGCNSGKCAKSTYKEWDSEGFYSWVNGVDIPKTKPEEPTKEEDAFMEDDLPFEVPEEPEVPIVINVMDEIHDEKPIDKDHDKPFWAIPESGNMEFAGRVENILDSVRVLLGGANVRVRISWDVQHETYGFDQGE